MTENAPYYEPLYAFLEEHGYVRNVSIRVAGYDARLTPDMNGFVEKTVALIEQTYAMNRQTPVHLVGHSNGPLYAQYLLTHTTQQWKSRYIHGFTSIAGNFPGQGLFYPVFFTGFNIVDFEFPSSRMNAATSALMHQSLPASYMSAADPNLLGGKEIVLKTIRPSHSFTPQDGSALFKEAHLEEAEQIAGYYVGFIQFAKADYFPNVDVYAEKGSGLSTLVGAILPELSVGQVFIPSRGNSLSRVGDSNQEDLTNDAVLVWQNMPCHHFELNDNPGVSHFDLPSTPALLERLLKHLQKPRTDCH
jgi:lysophospholipase-3